MNKSSNIFIKTEKNLDDLAEFIRKELNVSESIKYPFGGFQKRYGDNYGGDYYLIESLGLEINLVENKDEVLIDDMVKYNYYMMISNKYDFDIEEGTFDSVITFIAKLLNYKELETSLE